jgi:hypothetical protein
MDETFHEIFDKFDEKAERGNAGNEAFVLFTSLVS